MMSSTRRTISAASAAEMSTWRKEPTPLKHVLVREPKKAFLCTHLLLYLHAEHICASLR